MSAVFLGGGGVGHTSAALQIRTGGKDVLASGSVITADNRNLEFRLANVHLVMSFVGDGTDQKMEAAAVGPTLTLTLTNFNNPLGSGTITPIEIGAFGGRKLWLGFVVAAFNPSSTKVVDYTFLLGDAT